MRATRVEQSRLAGQLVQLLSAPPGVKAALRRVVERGAGALGEAEVAAVEAQALKCSPGSDRVTLCSLVGQKRVSFANFLALLCSLTDSVLERQLLARIGAEAEAAGRLEGELQEVNAQLRRLPQAAPLTSHKENITCHLNEQEGHTQQALNALLFENNMLRVRVDALRKDVARLEEMKRDWHGFIEAKVGATAKRMDASRAAMDAGRRAEARLKLLVGETQQKFRSMASEREEVAASMRKQVRLQSFLKKKTKEKNLLRGLESQIAQKSELLQQTVRQKEAAASVLSAAGSREAFLEKIEGKIYKALGLKSLAELQKGFVSLHENRVSVEKFIAELREEEKRLDEDLYSLKTDRVGQLSAAQAGLPSDRCASARESEDSQLQLVEGQIARNSALLSEIEGALSPLRNAESAGVSRRKAQHEIDAVKALLNALEAGVVETMLGHAGTLADQIVPLLGQAREEVEAQIRALFTAPPGDAPASPRSD